MFPLVQDHDGGILRYPTKQEANGLRANFMGAVVGFLTCIVDMATVLIGAVVCAIGGVVFLVWGDNQMIAVSSSVVVTLVYLVAVNSWMRLEMGVFYKPIKLEIGG